MSFQIAKPFGANIRTLGRKNRIHIGSPQAGPDLLT